MLVCPYCSASLTINGDVVIACSCVQSTQRERMDRAARQSWRELRDQKYQEELEERRNRRKAS